MQNSTFNPVNVSDFTKDKLNKDCQGIINTIVTVNTATNIDFTLTDDEIIAGGHVFLVKDATWGDYVDFQIVHPTNGVLIQFITNWPINPDVKQQQIPISNYPAKIITGLILRIIYHSTSLVLAPSVSIGYNFEKPIV